MNKEQDELAIRSANRAIEALESLEAEITKWDSGNACDNCISFLQVTIAENDKEPRLFLTDSSARSAALSGEGSAADLEVDDEQT